MEYSPDDLEGVRLKSDANVDGNALSAQQLDAIRKAHSLFGFYAKSSGESSTLSRRDLVNAIYAVTDDMPKDDLVDQVLEKYSKDKLHLDFDGFRALLQGTLLFPEHNGRYWVALSLAEAETIRRILHVRKGTQGKHQHSKTSTELCLRYSPLSSPNAPPYGDGGVVFDSSSGWSRKGSGVTRYEAAVAHNCFRYFDCDMYFADSALNILLRALKGRYGAERSILCRYESNPLKFVFCLFASLRDRERFFQATVGCRRRLERKVQCISCAYFLFFCD